MNESSQGGGASARGDPPIGGYPPPSSSTGTPPTSSHHQTSGASSITTATSTTSNDLSMKYERGELPNMSSDLDLDPSGLSLTRLLAGDTGGWDFSDPLGAGAASSTQNR